MNKILALAMCLMMSGMAMAQNYTVSGYVKDASNGETLIGASVLIKGTAKGVVTNVYGFYSLTLPAGQYEMEYRYVGFDNKTSMIDLSSGDQRVDIELADGGQKLEEVVIKGEADDVNVTGVQMSVSKLEMKTISKMPAFLGEVDVIKSIQQLPGVSTVGEGASGFNVRGGNVGQNNVLLDEAQVYNSSHMLGFFSVFNPDAVKDVQLYKGGMPARYGGRIASVLDVRMKEGNAKEFHGQGGIGAIFSRLAFEGPIAKDKASFIVAGRRSYIDVLARPFTDVFDDGVALNFYDFTAKTNWNVNDKNRIYLSGYLGRDNFGFGGGQGINWGNRTLTLRWNHIFTSRLFMNLTALTSKYDYALTFGTDDDNRFDWASNVTTYDLIPEFTYFLNSNNELTFGGNFSMLDFEPAIVTGVTNGVVIDLTQGDRRTLQSALHLDNNHKINSKLDLRYGLRFSMFQLLGSGKKYIYSEDGEPGVRKELLDEVDVSSGDIIANYNTIEPRFAAKYELNSSNSIKASYDKNAQYIHLISNTAASTPFDVWMPSSNNIEPQIGHQAAVGWFKNFNNNSIEFSAETYYRWTKNQIDYIDGADLLINERLEGDILAGDGRAYGIETVLRKNTGKLTGWVSYTIARTELQVDGINENNWYPTRFDQTHSVKVASFYDLTERLSLSANFTFLTGTPISVPTTKSYVQGYPIYVVDGRNNFRLPVYHRLDVAATLKNKKYKSNGELKKWQSYWVFSVYNLYANRNPFSITFIADPDAEFEPGKPVNTQALQTSILGSLVPSISYNFNF
ncbi:TonB-dependent receptor [Reichenbachiella versicolor]|uniref:TonB-dependent receptor n=1 Tax=Reichenbachiella versicolor TaxID=1821036 RepID=UPI001FE6432E|nr:TonB-dependent receptor [Reichenbachiella versicolor]